MRRRKKPWKLHGLKLTSKLPYLSPTMSPLCSSPFLYLWSVLLLNHMFRDFGSIFSTLLPGTMAKLEPPEGGTFLDGLEVRVAFGKVWKQSLSELSGGQRSLLALSLILALLLFKPAPLYILDEVHLCVLRFQMSQQVKKGETFMIWICQVDAALDLSHTQNIGRMIKAHFPHSQVKNSISTLYLILCCILKIQYGLKNRSLCFWNLIFEQFIVVSLKEGMFNNANVLFRTKFVDGVSTVQRTVTKQTKWSLLMHQSNH